MGQAELLPVLCAKSTWPEVFFHTRVLNFVDNDAARFGLIKGFSPTLASARLLNANSEWDARLQSRSWVERVPSASNIGDPASRLDFECLLALGYVQRQAVIPEEWR